VALLSQKGDHGHSTREDPALVDRQFGPQGALTEIWQTSKGGRHPVPGTVWRGRGDGSGGGGGSTRAWVGRGKTMDSAATSTYLLKGKRPGRGALRLLGRHQDKRPIQND